MIDIDTMNTKNYKYKTSKYHHKYEKLTGGALYVPYESSNPLSVLDKLKADAHEAGYNLLDVVNATQIPHKIATAESLTAGLIFSTLVDIPIGGAFKYGCFGVYDSDAKRIFLGVETPDVYTMACATQMALGVLRNSNASIAIAVTGNAMPTPDNIAKLAEVFIATAFYDKSGTIKVDTQVYNFCDSLKSICDRWYGSNFYGKKQYLEFSKEESDPVDKQKTLRIVTEKGHELGIGPGTQYAPIEITAILSQCIRYATVIASFDQCKKMINKNTDNTSNPVTVDRVENINQSGIIQDKINLLDGKSNNKILSQSKIDRIKYECIDPKTCLNEDRTIKSEFTKR